MSVRRGVILNCSADQNAPRGPVPHGGGPQHASTASPVGWHGDPSLLRDARGTSRTRSACACPRPERHARSGTEPASPCGHLGGRSGCDRSAGRLRHRLLVATSRDIFNVYVRNAEARNCLFAGISSAPEGIRTPDLRFRRRSGSRVLGSAEPFQMILPAFKCPKNCGVRDMVRDTVWSRQSPPRAAR